MLLVQSKAACAICSAKSFNVCSVSRNFEMFTVLPRVCISIQKSLRHFYTAPFAFSFASWAATIALSRSYTFRFVAVRSDGTLAIFSSFDVKYFEFRGVQLLRDAKLDIYIYVLTCLGNRTVCRLLFAQFSLKWHAKMSHKYLCSDSYGYSLPFSRTLWRCNAIKISWLPSRSVWIALWFQRLHSKLI